MRSSRAMPTIWNATVTSVKKSTYSKDTTHTRAHESCFLDQQRSLCPLRGRPSIAVDFWNQLFIIHRWCLWSANWLTTAWRSVFFTYWKKPGPKHVHGTRTQVTTFTHLVKLSETINIFTVYCVLVILMNARMTLSTLNEANISCYSYACLWSWVDFSISVWNYAWVFWIVWWGCSVLIVEHVLGT